jgi:8-amino-7-oxononanoate synthase
MDLFEKCREFYANPQFAQKIGYPTNPRLAQALGVYPYFIPIESAEGTEVVVDGKRLIMLGSNNYLGLAHDPRVKAAAAEAIEKYGTSCTGSRFLNGTLSIHLELEDELARFTGKQKALVFSTGFQTNLGTISSLIGKDDIVITDKDAHASIIDGIRLTPAQKEGKARYFQHNDMDDLDNILRSYPLEQRKLVIVDGVFSMGGDIAPLPRIVPLCRKYGARLMVDDAHSIGVLGQGRGTAAHFDCVDEVDLVMGTFSKSLASIGGFIAGKKEVIHWIQHFARPFIFSASLPPPNVAAVLAALEIIREEPERVEKVNQLAAKMRAELKALNYNTGNSQTPIIPIIIGDQFKTLQAWDVLFKSGVYTNPALPPAVPSHLSMLRTSVMATHTEGQLEKVLSVFKQVKKKLRIQDIPPKEETLG